MLNYDNSRYECIKQCLVEIEEISVILLIFKFEVEMGFLNNYSPLRYPGGKASIADFFESMLLANQIDSTGTYCEPFAGGAGVALTLLFKRKVKNIIINDCDVCIAAFWDSVLNNSEDLINLIRTTPVSIEEWEKQRMIYNEANHTGILSAESKLLVGFATFFLNRCNRAGILPNAGPIGGRLQQGTYKLNARFNKDRLIQRIQKIAEMKSSIVFTSMDAKLFLDELPNLIDTSRENTFLYLDPPYYHNGQKLYLNFYKHKDHLELAKKIANFDFCSWIMTYDNCQEIREIYRIFPNLEIRELPIKYSMQQARSVTEILIVPKQREWAKNDKDKKTND